MSVNKVKACYEVGVHSEVHELPTDIDEDRVLAQIRRLNHNPDIHGILVQLPLAPQLDRDKVLATVSADKDVDGFHVHNLGALVIGNALFPPCTPYGWRAMRRGKGVKSQYIIDLYVNTRPRLRFLKNGDFLDAAARPCEAKHHC